MLLLPCVLWLGACSESDEDRLEAFAKAVSGEVSADRVRQALTTYVDPATQPVIVTVFGTPKEYGQAEAAELTTTAQRRLARIMGASLRVMRRRIEVDGDRGRVELQLLSRAAAGHTRYKLRKHGERWLVAELDVTR